MVHRAPDLAKHHLRGHPEQCNRAGHLSGHFPRAAGVPEDREWTLVGALRTRACDQDLRVQPGLFQGQMACLRQLCHYRVVDWCIGQCPRRRKGGHDANPGRLPNLAHPHAGSLRLVHGQHHQYDLGSFAWPLPGLCAPDAAHVHVCVPGRVALRYYHEHGRGCAIGHRRQLPLVRFQLLQLQQCFSADDPMCDRGEVARHHV
mmetsp:Transcript_70595/g.165367  ORF Transcript_70595/g.165367 Transcript_70595/m.165367 type:complete len:203 (+) Transcript_70595:1599-2207(+)